VASSVAGARSRHRQRWRVRPASGKLSNHTRLRTSARATTSPPRWLSASPPSLTRLIRTYVWVREYGGIEYGGLPVKVATHAASPSMPMGNDFQRVAGVIAALTGYATVAPS
jgi:hypothetical protein